MCAYVLHVCACAYICVSEMNDNNDKRDGRRELESLCYYKISSLPMKWHGVVKKQISYKCTIKSGATTKKS